MITNFNLFKVSKINSVRSNPSVAPKNRNNYKKDLSKQRMLNLTLDELKQIAKMRPIRGYKNMSKERLLSALNKSESTKSFDNERLNNIRKDFNKLSYRRSKPEIKKIRKNLHEIENKKDRK